MTQDNQKSDSESNTKRIFNRIQAEKFSRSYLLLLLLLVTILFFNVIKIFLVPIILAAAFTALFYPFYKKLLKFFRYKKSVSALACCLILLLGLMAPVYIVADLVSQEAIQLVETAFPKVRDIVTKDKTGVLAKIKKYPIVRRLDLENIDWQSAVQGSIKNVGNLLATIINKTSKGTVQVVTNLFVTLFTMFYFFRDGDQLVKRIKYLSPLDDTYEEGIIFRFISVTRATIKGTLLIGLIQGTMGGLTLWIFGVGSPILWGVVMVLLSVIPLVGAWLILYPAAIIQLITGHVWQGLGIIIVTVVLIGNIDNVLRPRLVGRDAGMHDLMVFFSTLGGLSVFGIMGFIVGPVIAVFFLTILDIYSIEFKSTLDYAQHSEFSEEEERAKTLFEKPAA